MRKRLDVRVPIGFGYPHGKLLKCLVEALRETMGVRAGVLIGAAGLVLPAVPMLSPAFLRLRVIPATAPA